MYTIKINVCLYVFYRIVNYAFDHVMIFSKVVVYEPTKFSKLVQPIFFVMNKMNKMTQNELSIYVISYLQNYFCLWSSDMSIVQLVNIKKVKLLIIKNIFSG